MSPLSRRARATLAAALLASVAGLSAPSAFAADELRPTIKLATSGNGGGIGDVNGDGLGDVLATGGKVIFGTRTPATLDLSQPLGTKGFTIRPVTDASKAVYVARLGDLDRDGFDDFSATVDGASTVYVVYGAAGSADVDLKQGPRVGVIAAPATSAAAYLGDWNGDGYDDFTVSWSIGKAYPSPNTNVSAGIAIVRGGATRITTLGATASTAGQRISAPATCQARPEFFWLMYLCTQQFGLITPIGDFDGDGKDDLSLRTRGRHWIIRGRADTAAIDALAPSGATEITGDEVGFNQTTGSVGDINGDGRDDLVASEFGSSPARFHVFFGRTSTATIPMSSADVTVSGVEGGGLVPAGDLDGDGRDDVVVTSKDDTMARYFTDLAFRGRQVEASQGTLIPGLPRIPGYAVRAAPLGDFDGDGKGDLLGEGMLLVTHGDAFVDTVPPKLTVLQDGADPIAPNDRNITTTLDEPATVRFEVVNNEGTVSFGSFTKEIAAGTRTFRWTPTKADGQPLAPGIYRLRGVARDAAGNEGAAVTSEYFMTVAPSAQTLRVSASVKFPDGLPLAQVPKALFQSGCAPGVAGYVPVPGTATIELRAGIPGEQCWLYAEPPEQFPVEVSGCTWISEWYSGGVRLPLVKFGADLNQPARPALTMAAGQNEAEVRFSCAGGVRLGDAVPPFSEIYSWWADGTTNPSTIPDVRRLTPPKANFQSIVGSSKVIDANTWKYSFTAQATGGNGAAEGLAIGFLPESAPKKVGAVGGGLGIGGTGATVIAFDMSKGPGDPADQFIGISDSTMTGGHLNYQQTAPAGHKMRGTAFKVDVTQKNGVLTVATNGVVRLTRTMTLPTNARVVFSAATGPKVFQEHLVSKFSMTRP